MGSEVQRLRERSQSKRKNVESIRINRKCSGRLKVGRGGVQGLK
jgi:hypothetical protein